MSIREFAFPSTPYPSAPALLNSDPVAVHSKSHARPFSISAGKAKPVRKARNLANLPSCGWYEAEDRTMPSVSSF